MKLFLVLVAVLAIAASAIEAEIKGTVYGAKCSEQLQEEFFTKCIDDVAETLGFRNRNLREPQRELKCNQKEWCTNPPPYSYCWLNCRNARRLVLDDTDSKRFLSVLDHEKLETAAEACLSTEAETYSCLGLPDTIEVKITL